MRTIKFRAWVKHTTNNRFEWAYKQADDKATNITNNGFEVTHGEESEWRREFEDQWDKEHKPEEQYTIVQRMALQDELAISLNGKHAIRHGYEILDVMQFTGLLDKNGREIFEGDLVKATFDQLFGEVTRIGEIEYSAGMPMWVIDFPNDGVKVELKAIEDAENIEVIGNIHENPELVK